MRKGALILFGLLVSGAAASQTADSVLDKYYKAVGTKERWLQLKSKVDKYETKRASAIPDANHATINYNSGLFFKVAKRKGLINLVRYFSVQENHPKDTSTSTFNGTDYWFQFNNGVQTRQMLDISEVAKNSNLGHTERLLQANHYDYIGVQQIDEITCAIVRVKTENAEMDYYFDTSTNYLVLYHGTGKTLKTKLDDYRDIDGLKIPFFEEISNEFGVISSHHLVEVRIDLTVDDNYFSKLIGEGLVLK